MPPSRRSSRWLLVLLGFCLAALAWKALWRYGPGQFGGPAAPALFPVQARALLRAHRGAPAPVFARLPAPGRGTSAEAQARLMDLWDGRGWTARAVRSGTVEGTDLRVPAGHLETAQIVAVSAETREGGRATCRIDYRVRWAWPDPDPALVRAAPILGLRLPRPAGLAAPGQEAARTLVLEWDGWAWRPRDAGRDPSWPWLAWLF